MNRSRSLEWSAPPIEGDLPPRALDGTTLFRFAHMWRQPSSGGVEGYLHNLNRTLLENNRMRILQMYLSPPGGASQIQKEKVGQGELVWIPSPYKAGPERPQNRVRRLIAALTTRRPHEPAADHALLLSVLASMPVTLAVFHWVSDDSEVVMDCLRARNVPLAVVHHFDNGRLRLRRVRRQLARAVAVGGVTDTDVPTFVRRRFTHLSDAVDTQFFCRDKATPVVAPAREPSILLPSRVYQEKGHLDAIRALIALKQRHIKARLVLAGRVESESFLEAMMRLAVEHQVQDQVLILREVSPHDLRNWYAASQVVILPSYAEGLPRVLLEAQAMGTPVVAYDVGGVAGALVDGQTGWLVKMGDVEGLADRIGTILAGTVLRRDMGQRARHFVTNRFSLEKLSLRHEQFYSAAISAASPSTTPTWTRQPAAHMDLEQADNQ